MSDSCDPVDWPVRLHYPWDSPGKNTGVGCHAVLQGISLNQGLNSHFLYLLRWQVCSLQHQCPLGSPNTFISIFKYTDEKNKRNNTFQVYSRKFSDTLGPRNESLLRIFFFFFTKICLVKAMVFPVVMYGCDSWTVKKAER